MHLHTPNQYTVTLSLYAHVCVSFSSQLHSFLIKVIQKTGAKILEWKNTTYKAFPQYPPSWKPVFHWILSCAALAYLLSTTQGSKGSYKDISNVLSFYGPYLSWFHISFRTQGPQGPSDLSCDSLSSQLLFFPGLLAFYPYRLLSPKDGYHFGLLLGPSTTGNYLLPVTYSTGFFY